MNTSGVSKHRVIAGGGLASSSVFEGQAVEQFYHFICCSDDPLIQLADELGLSDQLRWKQTRTLFYTDRTLKFPFADVGQVANLPYALENSVCAGYTIGVQIKGCAFGVIFTLARGQTPKTLSEHL